MAKSNKVRATDTKKAAANDKETPAFFTGRKKSRLVKASREALTTVAAAIEGNPKVETSSATKEPSAAPQPQAKPVAKVAKKKPATNSSRALASRRTADGKFTKVIFAQIGGKECPRFAPMTWKERDAFMQKPEGAAVRERYVAHMATLVQK
jgi:hypothetical protein